MIWLLPACMGTAPPPADSDPPPAAQTTADTAPPFDPWAAGLVGDAARGAGSFSLLCATCHGAEGRGALGPSLVPLVRTYTDLDLYVLVTEGRGAMPQIGFESAQEAVDVIAFLRLQFP